MRKKTRRDRNEMKSWREEKGEEERKEGRERERERERVEKEKEKESPSRERERETETRNERPKIPYAGITQPRTCPACTITGGKRQNRPQRPLVTVRYGTDTGSG